MQSLRSSFILRSTGENVTAQAEGSSTVLQQDEGGVKLFILIPGMRTHQLTTNLTLVIARLLGGCILNLQPLSCMLNCSPSEIDLELNFHRISKQRLADALAGTKLTSREQARVTIAQGRLGEQQQGLRAGAAVVWEDRTVGGGTGMLRHGVVISTDATGEQLTVRADRSPIGHVVCLLIILIGFS